jgi:hypothetical protein
VFFFARRLGAQLPRVFLSSANGRIKRKQALFLSRFRDFLCTGISNTTAHISLQKFYEKPQKIPQKVNKSRYVGRRLGAQLPRFFLSPAFGCSTSYGFFLLAADRI